MLKERPPPGVYLSSAAEASHGRGATHRQTHNRNNSGKEEKSGEKSSAGAAARPRVAFGLRYSGPAQQHRVSRSQRASSHGQAF